MKVVPTSARELPRQSIWSQLGKGFSDREREDRFDRAVAPTYFASAVHAARLGVALLIVFLILDVLTALELGVNLVVAVTLRFLPALAFGASAVGLTIVGVDRFTARLDVYRRFRHVMTADLLLVIVTGAAVSCVFELARRNQSAVEGVRHTRYSPSGVIVTVLACCIMPLVFFRPALFVVVCGNVGSLIIFAGVLDVKVLLASFNFAFIGWCALRYTLKQERLVRGSFMATEDFEACSLEALREEARNAVLLRNTFPEAVLKEIGSDLSRAQQFVEQYDDVTVMFAAIHGLDDLDEHTMLVLDDVIAAFDGQLDNHNVEKIKTIGAGYMAASGAPSSCKGHAQAIIDFAGSIQSVIGDLAVSHQMDLALKIGVNSGSVVGGIVGRLNYAFDIFGDTVNVASRMCSQGVVGRIQVSPKTAALLNMLDLQPRGKLIIKGKGEMEVFMVKETRCMGVVSARSGAPKGTLFEFLTPTMVTETYAGSASARMSVISAGTRKHGPLSARTEPADTEGAGEVLGISAARHRFSLRFANVQLERDFTAFREQLPMATFEVGVGVCVPLAFLLHDLLWQQLFPLEDAVVPWVHVTNASGVFVASVWTVLAAVFPARRRFAAMTCMGSVVAGTVARAYFAAQDADLFLTVYAQLILSTAFCTQFEQFPWYGTAHWIFLILIGNVLFSLFVGSFSSSFQNVFASTFISLVGARNSDSVMRKTWFVQHAAHQLAASAEQRRATSGMLLQNSLPQPIIEVLRTNPTVVCSRYRGVSVLFADIVGFTELSSRMSAPAVVELLNKVFGTFDDLVELHEVEKIKTIGDAYVVASGLLSPSKECCARITRMGLNMIKASAEHGVTIRVGIHHGHVFAGCLGRRKFAWDCFGPVVEMAESLEAGSLPGRVHLSLAAYHRLDGALQCIKRAYEDGSAAVYGFDTYLAAVVP